MDKLLAASGFAIGALFLGNAGPSAAVAPTGTLSAKSYVKLVPGADVRRDLVELQGPRSLQRPEPLRPPPPPTAQKALRDGVLVVVSLTSQQAFVFQKGKAWDSTPVSTGKPGKDTPAGVFPILEKKVHHRSTLYDDAPMPYMQRLTWDGIALHAGRVPGYPASHGCIRLPKEFAQKLFAITNFSATVVVVTDKPVESAKEARKLA